MRWGLGSLMVVNALGQTEASPKFTANLQGLTAKRWAMAIDMKKCWEKGPSGLRIACLPATRPIMFRISGPKKKRSSGYGKEKYENTFPGQQGGMEPEEIREKPFLVLCNHCTHAPCTRVCPTQGHFQKGRWNYDDGFPPLHRLPVLHGWLPLRIQEL